MIAVILGPPGAGKSKQSELLRDRDHIEWLYVGKLLRDQNGSKINEYMRKGELVPDFIVNELVAEFINAKDPAKVVVIDGFPRHLPQAEWLINFSNSSDHKLSAVIHLMVPASVTKERLKDRGRDDDKPHIVESRLDEYERDIAPVIGFFDRAGIPIHPVDGNRAVEDVFSDMDRILESVHKG